VEKLPGIEKNTGKNAAPKKNLRNRGVKGKKDTNDVAFEREPKKKKKDGGGGQREGGNWLG